MKECGRCGMRSNNKMDMTVTEQIKAIREGMCKSYCKYHEKGEQLINPDDYIEFMDKHCKGCPIREL